MALEVADSLALVPISSIGALPLDVIPSSVDKARNFSDMLKRSIYFYGCSFTD